MNTVSSMLVVTWPDYTGTGILSSMHRIITMRNLHQRPVLPPSHLIIVNSTWLMPFAPKNDLHRSKKIFMGPYLTRAELAQHYLM